MLDVILELDAVLLVIDYLVLGKPESAEVRSSYHLQQVTFLEFGQRFCAAGIEKIVWLYFGLIRRPGDIDGLALC